MYKLLLLFFCLPTFAFSLENDPYELATFGGEPSAIVDGCVSAITGDLFLTEKDLVVVGKQPIVIEKKYFSRNGQNTFSGWEYFFDALTLTRDWPLQGTPILQIPEKQGFHLLYKGENKGKDRYTYEVIDNYPDSLTNCSTGEISGRLNSKNNKVFDNPESEREIIVISSDGSRRCYHLFDKQYKPYSQTFRLTSECLPNRNMLHYKWALIDETRRLVKITTTSPSGKEYAWVKIDYIMGDSKHLDKIHLTSSDGQTLVYHFDSHVKHGGVKHTLLSKVFSSTQPTQKFHYWKSNTSGLYLSKEEFPESRQHQTNFYTLGHNTAYHSTSYIPNEKDGTYRRVKCLKKPVGPNGELTTTHQFLYEVGKYKKGGGATTVVNAQGDLTVYYYNKYFLLTKIRHLVKENTTFFTEEFHWHPRSCDKPNWLKSKVLKDQIGTPFLCYEYFYDSNGNVVKEKLKGNLTGENPNDSYTIKRTFYPNNLLKIEHFPNEKSDHYTYLEKTDLITAKYTCDRNTIKIRNFYYYADSVLTHEILDDGSSQNPNNLSEVSMRHIKEITSHPETNLPHVISEYALDLNTHSKLLLKKQIIHYNPYLLIEKIDYYDANNSLAYSIHYQYDAQRRLISETTPLGELTTYSYDANNNLIQFQNPTEPFITQTTYDLANRPIVTTQKTSEGKTKFIKRAYNTLNQKILETTDQNHTSKWTYDPFNNPTHIEPPQYYDVKTDQLKSAITHATFHPLNVPLTKTDSENHTTQKHWTLRKEPSYTLHPDQSEETFLYDISGNLIKHTSPSGTVTLSTYDFLDRLTSKKQVSPLPSPPPLTPSLASPVLPLLSPPSATPSSTPSLASLFQQAFQLPEIDLYQIYKQKEPIQPFAETFQPAG